MPAETTTEVEEVSALITKASENALDSFSAFTDILETVRISDDGVALPLHEAHALLDQAYIARQHVTWALEESDKVLVELSHQVDFAEQHESSQRYDAEKAKEGDDA